MKIGYKTTRRGRPPALFRIAAISPNRSPAPETPTFFHPAHSALKARLNSRFFARHVFTPFVFMQILRFFRAKYDITGTPRRHYQKKISLYLLNGYEYLI